MAAGFSRGLIVGSLAAFSRELAGGSLAAFGEEPATGSLVAFNEEFAVGVVAEAFVERLVVAAGVALDVEPVAGVVAVFTEELAAEWAHSCCWSGPPCPLDGVGASLRDGFSEFCAWAFAFWRLSFSEASASCSRKRT